MDADEPNLIDEDLTDRVLGVFYDVYNELGPGFIESVYENAMALALREAGLGAAQQAALTVCFRGKVVGEFRADILVEGRLVLELKAVSQLNAIHEVQLVNYLKASQHQVGLLLNFGPSPQFKRRVYEQLMKNPRSSASIRVKKHVQ